MPSSLIRAYAYHAPTKTLAVTFTSGRQYRYYEVSPETYEAMRAAFSKGEFFNRQIRDQFRFTIDG